MISMDKIKMIRVNLIIYMIKETQVQIKIMKFHSIIIIAKYLILID